MDSIGSNTSTQVLNFRDLIRRAAARNNIDNSTTLHLVVRLAWKEAEAEGLVARCILFVRLLCLLFVCTWFFASRGHERDIFIETSSSVYPSLCVAECQVHYTCNIAYTGCLKKTLINPTPVWGGVYHPPYRKIAISP